MSHRPRVWLTVRRLPPGHGIRIFHKGISSLTRVTGTEHRQISRFLLGLIIDAQLPDHAQLAPLIRASRSLLDFLYIAQYPSHTADTLTTLENALAQFHEDRDVFIELGIRTGFNLPKLHSLQHYVRAIKLYGTTDNYNTEATERLHIDFAKDAYRATNHRNEFPQMTQWLERREKILHHANFIAWRVQQQTRSGTSTISAQQELRWRPPDMACALNIKMTKNPTRKAVSINEIVSPLRYGATFFIPALARFVVQFNDPSVSAAVLEERAADIILPVATLPVYHHIKFWNESVHGKTMLDSVHVHPRSQDSSGSDTLVQARFDTVLVQVRPIDGARTHGLQGMSQLHTGRI